MSSRRAFYVPDAAISITDKSGKIQADWFQALLQGHKMGDRPITIGIDEVGVGSWFGPMVVVGVVNLNGWHIDGIKDSKKIRSEKVRRALASEIQHNCLYVVASCEAGHVERYSTTRMLEVANTKIAKALIAKIREQFPYPQPKIEVIMDGEGKNWTEDEVTYKSIPQADASVFEVSAASIVAKVLCDNWIHEAVELDPLLKRYDLDSNKGYGSAAHIAAIKQYGITPHHRATFCRRHLPGA